MERILKIFKDNGKIVIQYAQEPGKPHKIEQYWTMRGGISWPTTKTKGYYCILGLKDEPATTRKPPLVLWDEGEAGLPEKFFDKISVSYRRFYCSCLYADLDDNHKNWKKSFRKFIRVNKAKGILLRDSSDFFNLDGNLLIKQYKRDGALVVPKGTILRDQLGKVTPDVTLSDFENYFYAVSALIKVLVSFEVYPWSKPSKQFTGFTNWKHRIKNKPEVGYQEYFVD